MDWLVRNLSAALVILGVTVCAFTAFRLTPNEVGTFAAARIGEAVAFARETIIAWTSDDAEAPPAPARHETVTVMRDAPVIRAVPAPSMPDTLFIGSQVMQAAFVARMEAERAEAERADAERAEAERAEAARAEEDALRPAIVADDDAEETVVAGGSSVIIPLEQPPETPAPEAAPRIEPLLEPEPLPGFGPGQQAQTLHPVALRMLAQLPPEIVGHFDLFLYVSKSDAGPWAQQMFVFDKEDGEAGMPRFTLLHQWFVSTGRETEERNARGELMSTATPQGIFKLDPDRFYHRYWSSQWDQSMPWTMFFDYQTRGNPTGLAIHGTVPETVAELGARASAGCIRLAPENAKTLYRLIRRNYAGTVPRFRIDRTGTMSSEGIVLRNRQGNPRMEQGYRVIVLIDNFSGEDAVIATLY